jgi:hypothetical protein
VTSGTTDRSDVGYDVPALLARHRLAVRAGDTGLAVATLPVLAAEKRVTHTFSDNSIHTPCVGCDLGKRRCRRNCQIRHLDQALFLQLLLAKIVRTPIEIQTVLVKKDNCK